jgi:hypothetical protein
MEDKDRPRLREAMKAKNDPGERPAVQSDAGDKTEEASDAGAATGAQIPKGSEREEGSGEEAS